MFLLPSLKVEIWCFGAKSPGRCCSVCPIVVCRLSTGNSRPLNGIPPPQGQQGRKGPSDEVNQRLKVKADRVDRDQTVVFDH